jgi:hypothetical protein
MALRKDLTMNIQPPLKTIVTKRPVGNKGETVYVATDRYGDSVMFVGEQNYSVGSKVTIPKKPSDPMTVTDLWKKGKETLPPLGVSGVIAISPQIAQTLSASDLAKIVLSDVGLPEHTVSITPIKETAGFALDVASHPLFRHLAIFAAGFVAALGIQKVW